MKNAISLNLDADRFDHANHTQSLGELLEQAVRIICPGVEPYDERRLREEMRWITKQAVRAVCELLIRERVEIKMPLRVEFADKAGIPPWRLDYGGDYSLN